MKRNLYTLIILFFFSCFLHAQVVFDTVEVRSVGPGMTYYKIKTGTPWSIDLFKADINNQYFRVETVKSLDKLAAGREKTTSMAGRRTWNGHWAVAAINGDFFDLGTGMPNSLQVERGEALRNERVDYPSAGFDTLGNVSISKPVFSAAVKMRDTTITITNINVARPASGLVLYNRFYGNSTGTTNTGTEVIIRIPGGWSVNDTLIGIVDSVRTGIGNTGITPFKAVLSGAGNFASALDRKAVKGDTIKIIVKHLPSMPRLKEMISGHPLLVVNGAQANLDPADPFVTTRHPRTAIGVNSDTSALYLITVDGRQTYFSLGMDLYELADFMMRIGVYQGMNLDGGGSTTMAIRGGIVNSPSDAGGERTVANALLVISTAPLDTLMRLEMQPRINRVFAGTTIQFSVSGTDIHYNPVTINVNQVQFSLSKPSLGTINSSGLFTAGANKDSGYLIARYQGLTDSVRIDVKGIGYIRCEPRYAVTDFSRLITFRTRVFDTDSVEQSIPTTNVQWRSLDSTIGVIDAFGQFQGRKAGIVKIVGTYSAFSDTATVHVQIGFGTSVVDSIESLSGFTLTTQNVDSIATVISIDTVYSSYGNASIKLDYSFTYQSGMYFWAYLNKISEVFGVPDSTMIDIRSDGAGHRIFFDLMDQYGSTQRVFTNKVANVANTFDMIKGPFPKTSAMIYPMSLKSVAIALGSSMVAGQTYSGTIYIDNIRVKYPPVPSAISRYLTNTPSSLAQNYPNPFNRVSRIRFTLYEATNIELTVYDIFGQTVDTLAKGYYKAGEHNVFFDAGELASGVYIYRLKTGNKDEFVRKMLLTK
ncbi:MAG: phosphodiester glycosidase family protein [Ignavibacteriaceae bacterium]|nr:phosphodiester glycosidase family protein [Ignavibacteriaceae bacterium]